MQNDTVPLLWAAPLPCRIMTFTWVALLFGLMGYNVQLQGLDGFNSVNNM
jgi:hypothetical protein